MEIQKNSATIFTAVSEIFAAPLVYDLYWFSARRNMGNVIGQPFANLLPDQHSHAKERSQSFLKSEKM